MYKRVSRFISATLLKISKSGSDTEKSTRKDPHNPCNLKVRHENDVRLFSEGRIKQIAIVIDKEFGMPCPFCDVIIRLDAIERHLLGVHDKINIITVVGRRRYAKKKHKQIASKSYKRTE